MEEEVDEKEEDDTEDSRGGEDDVDNDRGDGSDGEAVAEHGDDDMVDGIASVNERGQQCR